MGSILDKEREGCNYIRDCLSMKILSCHSPTFSGSTLKTNEINWLLCFRLPIHYPLMQNTQLLLTITTTKAGATMSSSMIWNSLFSFFKFWSFVPNWASFKNAYPMKFFNLYLFYLFYDLFSILEQIHSCRRKVLAAAHKRDWPDSGCRIKFTLSCISHSVYIQFTKIT